MSAATIAELKDPPRPTAKFTKLNKIQVRGRWICRAATATLQSPKWVLPRTKTRNNAAQDLHRRLNESEEVCATVTKAQPAARRWLHE